MLSYRFTLLAADRSIESAVTLRAGTDDAAAEIAAELLAESAASAVEVWENARLVFRAGKA